MADLSGLASISLPSMTDEQLDDAKERRQIREALYQLTEQLRYVLSNLDEENITPELEEKIEQSGNNGELYQRVESAEGGLSSLRQQTAEGFSQTVRKGNIISAINQSAEAVTILANKISLEGAVTINGTFEIDDDGYLRCTGGELGNLIVGDDSVSISSSQPFHVGGISLYGSSIGGVTSMPHLVLSKYNLDYPDVDDPGVDMMCLTSAGKVFLRKIQLDEVWDDQNSCYRYSLSYVENSSHSSGGPVDATALRITTGFTNWYTNSACTSVGGKISPNDTFKLSSGNRTSGKMQYDESTGFWSRVDTTTRYLKPGSYYSITVRMQNAND